MPVQGVRGNGGREKGGGHNGHAGAGGTSAGASGIFQGGGDGGGACAPGDLASEREQDTVSDADRGDPGTGGGEPRMAADADGPAVETGRGPVSGALAQAGGKGGAGIRGIDTGGVCEGEQGMAETEEGREGYGTGTDGDHGTGTAPGGRPGQGGRHA